MTDYTLDDLSNRWDELAHLDPLWAIVTDPQRRFGRWDVEEFFRTGHREIGPILARGNALGYPKRWDTALDFGCGVGRLSRPLAGQFTQCYGVDVSPKMIELARTLNKHISNCSFLTSEEQNLRDLPDNHFDLVCSLNVLQHLPQKSLVLSYLAEFVRVVNRGGLLIFQLPVAVPFRARTRSNVAGALYVALRRLGFDAKLLYRLLRLAPITMISATEEETVAHLSVVGATVVDVQHRTEIGVPESRVYFVVK